MKHDFTVTALVAATLGVTAALSAQERSRPNLARTLIGCVEAGGKNTSDLLLTHAALEGAPGRPGPGGTTKDQELYRLAAIGDLKLADLVGHRVRVAGVLEKEPPRTGRPEPPAQPIDDRRGGTSPTRGANAPTFRVTAVKSLAVNCPSK